jgi:hypothetical protein
MLFGHEQDDLFCFYDRVKRLAVVSFRNTMNEAVMNEAEQWLESVQRALVPLQGILCDVKAVRRFADSLPFQVGEIPLVFLVANPFQGTTVLKLNQPPRRDRIAIAYEEAFTLFGEKLLQNEDTMMFNSVGTSVYYDNERHCACITYYGIINPLVTSEVYANLASTIGVVGIETVRGSLYDFRHVTDFDNSNLNAVRRTSSNMNVNYDMSHIAVALIVGTTMQDSMVRMSMKITPQEERKRIVRSFAEAYRFVDEFQAKRTALSTKDME